MSVYTDSHGRKRPISQRTIFAPARNEEASRRIMIDTPANAHHSIAWLNEEWSDGGHERRVHLVRYANEAANRAGIIADSPRVSRPQRKEAAEVQGIYRAWTDSHKGREGN